MKKLVVGVLAHVDSGKTTLSEAMLYITGAIKKLGRVDHRDSFLDTFTLERSRGITIFSKQAVFEYKNTEFTLLDTPGHVDFSAETERTLQVLDYAILVINGSSGVQSHTVTLWNLLKKYKVPCFIFVNKMDIANFGEQHILSQLRERLSESCINFSDDENELFENIALCNEELFDRYERGYLSKKDISLAVKGRKIIPCMFGSALKLNGVEQFLQCLYDYSETPDYKNSFAAKVYKISEDKQGNRLTHLKVTGGVLRVKDILSSNKNINSEKVNQIRIYSGEKFSSVKEASAGSICAVSGITFARTGDGLGAERNSEMPVLAPVLTYKLIINDETDVHTVLNKLRIIEDEDPQLNVVWNEELKEIQLQLMGVIQLEILKSIISERFGISVDFGKGNIIYKETIDDTVEGIGHFEPLRHYAEVHLLLKPAERNSGVIFKSECEEDVLDKNWQRLILTHLYEKTHIGVLTGSPITDMEITLVSGKAHPKHTEGGDFRQATYRAVRQGLRSAKSILLEPVYSFSLEVPNDCVGRALSDISRMYGSFNPPEIKGEYTLITGKAPVSEMSEYNNELMQYTHGTGKLSFALIGYEPCHNEQEVIEEIAYNPDADIQNTADSVFCSHGAGYNVKWNEVKSHMHLPSALSSAKKDNGLEVNTFSNIKSKDNIFSLDKELMQIFEKTYGPVKKRRFSESITTHSPNSNKNESYRRSKSRNYDGKDYLLVDGYNVIFAWDSLNNLSKSSIDGARNALINILCNYQGYKKCEVILVFDAYKVKGNKREIEKINNISIVYTKEAETADMYIEKVTHSLAKNNRVRVVTSDGLEQLIILGNGALRVSSRAFLEEVQQAEEEIKRIIDSVN